MKKGLLIIASIAFFACSSDDKKDGYEPKSKTMKSIHEGVDKAKSEAKEIGKEVEKTVDETLKKIEDKIEE